MQIAACLILSVCLVGLPPAVPLGHTALAAGDHESAVSHQGQPPIVRAQTNTRLAFPRFCTMRSEACALPDRHVAQLGATLSRQATASALAALPHVVLRI